MKRIETIIKLLVSVVIQNEGLRNERYLLIDGDDKWVGEIRDKDIAESICTLINGQSVDGIADIYKRDYTGVATNLDGISESVCKAEKCDAPNCYEGHEPKGCLMEGAHKPVVDVQKMAEEYVARLRQYATNDFHEFTYSYNQIIEAVKYGSTLKQDWVSVEERKPEEGQAVNIYCEGFTVAEQALFKNGHFERFPNQVKGERCILYHYEPVLYWMPLPSLPSPPKEIINP